MGTQEQINAYQPLFDHMANEHSLTLLQSEMDEIIKQCEKVIDNQYVGNPICGFVSTGNRPPCYFNRQQTCQNCEHKK